jgi:hypothetical protein
MTGLEQLACQSGLREIPVTSGGRALARTFAGWPGTLLGSVGGRGPSVSRASASDAVKGVVTAYWLYEEPTERPIGEDVRIRPEDFRRAARAFEAQIPRCRSTTVMRCSSALRSEP